MNNSFYKSLKTGVIGWSLILFTVLLTGCNMLDLVYEVTSRNTTPNTTTTPNPKNTQQLNQQILLQMVNYYRVNGCYSGNKYYPPTKPVVWNNKLAKAAQIHANDLKRNNYLDHIGSDGSSPGDRISRVGYQWLACSENIARGFSYERDVVEGWINSESHCKNIMNPNYTEVGMATNDTYWVQKFAVKQPKMNFFKRVFSSRKKKAK